MVGATEAGRPVPKLRQYLLHQPMSPSALQPFSPLTQLPTHPHPSTVQLLNPVESVANQPENPFARLIPDQKIAIVPSFTLESGVTLHNVPVAYTARGCLSKNRDNALVICHALSGSADVADWWGPLMGTSGQAFDASRFFIVCLNSLGSPYGSASPVTSKYGDVQYGRYGPEFPLTTIRDDVK
jgi:homoserine O-acetyltransferase/O-succinyltransferase